MQKKIIILIAIVILLLIFSGYFLFQYRSSVDNQQKAVVCTIEAKLCPDGSYVGRVGPNCDFTQCPDLTLDWNVLNNTEYGFSLKYPNNFFDVGHEPKIVIGNCNYNVFPKNCPNIVEEIVAGSGVGSDLDVVRSNWNNRVGKNIIINNMDYCVYHMNDAAMMHQYYYDYYTTVKNQKCIVVELDTVSVSCEVYLPLNEGDVEQAKNYNNCLVNNDKRPIILNEIINTFKLTK